MKTIKKYKDGKQPVGYCHSKVHKGYLTVEVLREHKCLEKNCTCLNLYKDHPWILERSLVKKRTKLLRNLRNLYTSGKLNYNQYSEISNKASRLHLKQAVEYLEVENGIHRFIGNAEES